MFCCQTSRKRVLLSGPQESVLCCHRSWIEDWNFPVSPLMRALFKSVWNPRARAMEPAISHWSLWPMILLARRNDLGNDKVMICHDLRRPPVSDAVGGAQLRSLDHRCKSKVMTCHDLTRWSLRESANNFQKEGQPLRFQFAIQGGVLCSSRGRAVLVHRSPVLAVCNLCEPSPTDESLQTNDKS